MFIFLFLLCVVVVEALTELIVKSMFFDSLRKLLKSKSKFIENVLSCGYCSSVWVALLPAAYLADIQTYGPALVAFFPLWLGLHRLSNFLHNINDKHFDKYHSLPKD